MMTNKLEEMKKRLLLQNKKEKVEVLGSPQVVEEPQPQPPVQVVPEPTSNPIKIQFQASISQSPENSVSAERQQKQSEHNEQIPQQISPQELKERKQSVIVENSQQKGNEENQQIEEGEAQDNNIQEEIVVNPNEVQERPAEQQQSLELIKEPNISISIDEQAKHLIQQRINEMQRQTATERPEQPKVQKKTKKIVLKQLIKVKECIRNMQSAVKGLEFIEQKLKYYPSLKEKLVVYIQELKSLSK